MRRRPASLEMLVFVVGAASLGTEIAAARLLAPWFGASTIVWANTIAIVLVALSVGYAVGGRMADRAPRIDRLAAASGDMRTRETRRAGTCARVGPGERGLAHAWEAANDYTRRPLIS